MFKINKKRKLKSVMKEEDTDSIYLFILNEEEEEVEFDLSQIIPLINFVKGQEVVQKYKGLHIRQMIDTYFVEKENEQVKFLLVKASDDNVILENENELDTQKQKYCIIIPLPNEDNEISESYEEGSEGEDYVFLMNGYKLSNLKLDTMLSLVNITLKNGRKYCPTLFLN
jgi:hypothetical protein